MTSYEWWKWQADRELGAAEWRRSNSWYQNGNSTPDGALYSSLGVVNSWNPMLMADHQHHGGVFGSDFSPDGSIMVAACEKQSILMFDPLNGKLVQHCNKAHQESVNCVRFLDNRSFATCSDDTTVKLWDARCLRQCVCTLRGHANWVKNIEYAPNEGVLVTSGFDGAIYSWNINEYTEDGTKYTRLFKMDGLMRAILTPDSKKLIISSMGYLMVVHNLDLDHIQKDLHGFKPNLYRLVQAGEQVNTHVKVDHFNPMFERHRNRVELIADFPNQDDADMISSLQVHPQGWCVASRNVTSDETSEWTCIHDIQDVGTNGQQEDEPTDYAEPSYSATKENSPKQSPVHYSSSSSTSSDSDLVISHTDGDSSSLSNSDNSEADTQTGSPPDVRWVHVDTLSDNEGTSTNDNTDNVPSEHTDAANATQNNVSPAQILMYIIRSGSSNVSARTVMFSGTSSTQDTDTTLNRKIHKNTPHLSHYIQEPNVGSGYIKEMCFSSDGRLICSPFAYGVRLLAFDPSCREMCDCITNKPTQLFEVGCNISHSNHVMTVNFSPTHCLFISGCLNGKVDFHQPRL